MHSSPKAAHTRLTERGSPLKGGRVASIQQGCVLSGKTQLCWIGVTVLPAKTPKNHFFQRHLVFHHNQ